MDAIVSEVFRWWVVVSMAACLLSCPLIMIERTADAGTRLLVFGTSSLVTLCLVVAAIALTTML